MGFKFPFAVEEKNAGSARTRAVGSSWLAVTPAAGHVRIAQRMSLMPNQ